MTETSEIWTGKASSYDRARPAPPPALLALLRQLIDMPRPALVVDFHFIGSQPIPWYISYRVRIGIK